MQKLVEFIPFCIPDVALQASGATLDKWAALIAQCFKKVSGCSTAVVVVVVVVVVAFYLNTIGCLNSDIHNS